MHVARPVDEDAAADAAEVGDVDAHARRQVAAQEKRQHDQERLGDALFPLQSASRGVVGVGRVQDLLLSDRAENLHVGVDHDEERQDDDGVGEDERVGEVAGSYVQQREADGDNPDSGRNESRSLGVKQRAKRKPGLSN